jgi:murein DD-endopeptidase MepM/ murein hydrolase activator NlpD
MTTLLDEIAKTRAKLHRVELGLTTMLDIVFNVRDDLKSWERGLAPTQPLDRWLRYPLPTVFPITSKFHDPPIPGVRETVHEGTDFGCPQGVAVLAAASGIVVSAHFNSAYGYRVQLEHEHMGETWQTWYCHLSQLRVVVPGQSVIMGQCIGLSGETGNVTGAHLHWNVVRKSNLVKIDGLPDVLRGCEDPMQWVILPT